ncbi:MAG: hypothetical protein HY937_05290 [Nitrosomonadales bacterium]|nr:hypothetical protein [Nitrosomonadales bacterium]
MPYSFKNRPSRLWQFAVVHQLSISILRAIPPPLVVFLLPVPAHVPAQRSSIETITVSVKPLFGNICGVPA